MENTFKITVPKPCHEDWDKMSPEETGRFCSSCTKVVVDFTKMKSDVVQKYFIENQNKSICGRFNKTQIETFDIHIPQYVLKRKMPFHKAFLLALFIAMGSSLFSCKNHNDATLGEVVVEDTVKVTHTMGAPLPMIDSTKISKSENMIIGEMTTKEHDSLIKAGVKIPPPPPPPPLNEQVKFVKPTKTKCKTQNVLTGVVALSPNKESEQPKKDTTEVIMGKSIRK